MPESAALYEPPSAAYPGLRTPRLKMFHRYSVYYRPVDGGIRVERALNNARDVGSVLDADSTPPSS
jgi:hypothetical protein